MCLKISSLPVVVGVVVLVNGPQLVKISGVTNKQEMVGHQYIVTNSGVRT